MVVPTVSIINMKVNHYLEASAASKEPVGVITEILAPFSTLFFIMGIVLAMIFMSSLLRGRTGGYGSSTAVPPLIMSIASFGIGIYLSSNRKSPADKNPITRPVPEPTEPGNPIVLPEVQNLEFLWLLPLALATLAGMYLLTRKIRIDRAAHKTASAEKARIEERVAGRWNGVKELHQLYVQKYMDAETDWDMLFSYPALQDSSVPQTAAMVRAMVKAGQIDDTQPSTLTEDSDLSQHSYSQAVNAFADAWHEAYEHAKKVGQTGITNEERKIIALIRQLLSLAENSAAAPNERSMAYIRAQKLIKTLQNVTIPASALLQIEQHQRLMLEA